ncbi:MAG TPA: hypothetical protein VIF62_20690, partial [Labilithrix sp.]
MPSRRIIAVALGLLVGCNALTGASDLAFDLDGGSAPVDASAPAPPPPSPIDAGIDDARGDASDASDGFVPFDGSDASNVKIVFVTSQSFVGGSLGGVAGGDSACAT